MPIMILASSYRRTTDIGQEEEKDYHECPEQNSCDLEPRARELARIISSQWVKTHDRPPPQAAPILYLEYPSAEPSGIVHYGSYDDRRRKFIEQESGEATPKNLVIAWMPIPKVPTEIYEESRFMQSQRAALSGDYPCVD